MTYVRIPTVKDVCELDPDALDFALSDQVEHLRDVLVETESNAAEFFARNYVTNGMATLLRTCLRRLSGTSKEAVFELRQAMGGGKTHSMLALGLLARHPEMYDRVPASVTADIAPTKARVVAVDGRNISKDRFLWGDIATQLGKAEEFSRFWSQGADGPGADDWISLLGDEPTLILIDELPFYMNYAKTRTVGGGTLAEVTNYAFSNLLSAAGTVKRTAVVVTNLTGAYQQATQALITAMQDTAQEAKRQALPITPVDLNTGEIYAIVRKRLFAKTASPDDIEKVATSYGDAIAAAVRSKSIARSPEQVAEEIRESYPFHPSVKNIIALFRENENFRQTRGLMLFMSKLLKSVWLGKETGDVYLIGCQHLDLSFSDIRDEVNRIGDLEGAMTIDVSAVDRSAHAQRIDATRDTVAASQAAKLLLTASLSQSVESVKGLSEGSLIEYLITPDHSATEFVDAFAELQTACWYLHRKTNDVWYFSKVENLRKRVQNRAVGAPAGRIEAELKRRLDGAFAPRTKQAYAFAKALPLIDEISIEATGRHCLVMSPDSRTPPEEATRFLESQTYKNGFCVVTGDGSSMGNIDEKVRQIWAVEKVRTELGDTTTHKAELDELAESAEFEFGSTLTTLFNRVYFPMPTADKRDTRLVHAPLKLSVERKDAKGIVVHDINGEAAVEAALSPAIGTKKLILDVPGNLETLVPRAEEMLWPTSQTRIPWLDVVRRAQSNSRWNWLPPKGLEAVRDHAVAVGRWTYDVDGFVDKSPPKPRTTATVIVRSRDDATGNVDLEVLAQNAGKVPTIMVSKTGDFGRDGTEVVRNPFPTNESKLWFLVTDPDGAFEQGESVVWLNTITLTHQPQFITGKRIVTLTAVPRGDIRWNTDGSNPRDGNPYTGPIEIDGRDPVTIYAYASDNGIVAEREFHIAGSEEDRAIDRNRPAVLAREIAVRGTQEMFRSIEAAEANNAMLRKPRLTVGEGARNIGIRMGDGVEVDPRHFRELVRVCRLAIGDENATVSGVFGEMSFSTGYDLEQFAAALGENVSVSDVEQ